MCMSMRRTQFKKTTDDEGVEDDECDRGLDEHVASAEEKLNFLQNRTGHNFLYNLLHVSCESEVKVQESVQYMVPCPFAGNVIFQRHNTGISNCTVPGNLNNRPV